MKKKQEWKVGAVFLIPQLDGGLTVAQVLDMMMPNIATCAIFDIRISSPSDCANFSLDRKKLIAKLATARHHLDAGAWEVVTHQKPALRQRDWPNEQFRRRGWIGAAHYS